MTEPTEIDQYGNKFWENALGELHREGGPAVEWSDGDTEWWANGQRHRADGPAIEYATGHKEWWVNGKLHRTDGPAIEWANGRKEWWANDKELTEEEHAKRIKEMQDE